MEYLCFALKRVSSIDHTYINPLILFYFILFFYISSSHTRCEAQWANLTAGLKDLGLRLARACKTLLNTLTVPLSRQAYWIQAN